MRTANSLVLIGCVALLLGCGEGSRSPAAAGSESEPAQSITELQKTDLSIGTGPSIAQGQRAVVHYTGWLFDPAAPDQRGKQFDSSRDRGQPFRFTIGEGRVIQGWEQGVAGMQAGGERRLIIPPTLGYGARGGGPIPPNSTLLFDIELLAIE